MDSAGVQLLIGLGVSLGLAVGEWRLTQFCVLNSRPPGADREFDHALVMGPLQTPGFALALIGAGTGVTIRISIPNLAEQLPSPASMLGLVNWADFAIVLSTACAGAILGLLLITAREESHRRLHVLDELANRRRRLRARLLASDAIRLRVLMTGFGVAGAISPMLVLLRLA